MARTLWDVDGFHVEDGTKTVWQNSGFFTEDQAPAPAGGFFARRYYDGLLGTLVIAGVWFADVFKGGA